MQHVVLTILAWHLCVVKLMDTGGEGRVSCRRYGSIRRAGVMRRYGSIRRAGIIRRYWSIRRARVMRSALV